MSERILSGWEKQECWEGREGQWSMRSRTHAHICVVSTRTRLCQTNQRVRLGDTSHANRLWLTSPRLAGHGTLHVMNSPLWQEGPAHCPQQRKRPAVDLQCVFCSHQCCVYTTVSSLHPHWSVRFESTQTSSRPACRASLEYFCRLVTRRTCK